MVRKGGWFWYLSKDKDKLEPDKCGKWMYFFEESEQDFAKEICQTAIDKNICFECKCTDIETRKSITGENTGVICFYQNGDDTDNHKRIIEFMIENNLIKKTKTGKFYNISFKFNNQTLTGEYGTDFEGKLKLENFIDLYNGKWIK